MSSLYIREHVGSWEREEREGEAGRKRVVVKPPLSFAGWPGEDNFIKGEKIGVTMTFCSSRAMISFLVPLRERKRRRFEDVAR